MSNMQVLGLIGLFFICAVKAIREEDLIKNLPNVTFNYSFKHYSGYVNANSDGSFRMFYWLTESMDNPETKPLIIWFNGGPGCSSLSGLLAEYGPFYVNRDGKSLYENVYAWNKHYNLLFLESPIGTGFSYSTEDPTDYTVGDDETAEQNFYAITDFFLRVQPKYLHRTFFLAGESYAGIFIPSLTSLILKGIQLREFPNTNFQGFAIGNGYVNVMNLTNSLVHWHVYHGSIGISEWQNIKQVCCKGTDAIEIENCDFSSHIKENQTDTYALDECGKLFVDTIRMDESQNAYNYYLDCYKPDQGVERKLLPNSKLKRVLQTANLLNYDFTDTQLGFNCWNEDAMKKYLNRKDVQEAIHVDETWIKHPDTKWDVCNDLLNEDYIPKYTDTFELFGEIIRRAQKLQNILPKNFRALIFNGDVDTVCNHIGVAWHMHNVGVKNGLKHSTRAAWRFRQQIAGYTQKYSKKLSDYNSLSIDVLTVKGAGHFVSDRPGPALQMLVNFVRNSGNFSDSEGVDTMPSTNDLFIEEEKILDLVTANNLLNNLQLSHFLLFLCSIVLLFVR